MEGNEKGFREPRETQETAYDAKMRETIHEVMDRLEKRLAEDRNKPVAPSLVRFNEARDALDRIGVYMETGRSLKRMGARERSMFFALVEVATAEMMGALSNTITLLLVEDAARQAQLGERPLAGTAADYPNRQSGATDRDVEGCRNLSPQ